eukprot:Hpha_TRINITY_DN14918_c4_g6::TRINITY_DN14918_c4_g6_i1::g.143001::m.143001
MRLYPATLCFSLLAAAAAGQAGDEEDRHVLISISVSHDEAWINFARFSTTTADKHSRLYPADPLRRSRRGRLLPDGTPPRRNFRHPHHFTSDEDFTGEPKGGHDHHGHQHDHPDARNDTEEYVHVLYPNTAGGAEVDHVYTFDCPRKQHIHSFDFRTGDWLTGIEMMESGIVPVVIPQFVRQVHVEYNGWNQMLEVPNAEAVRRWGRTVKIREKTKRGTVHTLQTTAASEVVDYTIDADGNKNQLNHGGPPETQNNFVFLAGGYTADQKNVFLNDLDYVMTLWDTNCEGYPGGADGACGNAIKNMPATVPYRRYASAMNVFAVWQPSVDQGASAPNEGITKSTNLACSYGTSVPRALLCKQELTIALADTAPSGAFEKKNVVSVVLVNADSYGGAASYRAQPTTRFGAFATGYFRPFTANPRVSSPLGTFGSLFFHEVGHCYANLMDEYDTGITESRDKDYVNCVSPQKVAANTIPWQGWMSCCTSPTAAKSHLLSTAKYKMTDALIGDATILDYFTVDTTVNDVCGWSNYKQPSANCMMEKLTQRESDNKLHVPRLCPVCREATVEMMYTTGLDISMPKCPNKDEELYVDDSRGSYIFLNSKIGEWKFLKDGGIVEYTWTCGLASGVSFKAAPWTTETVPRNQTDFDKEVGSYVYVTAADVRACAGGQSNVLTTVKVTVEDLTPWVGASRDRSKMKQEYTWNFKAVPDVTTSGAVRRCNASCANDTDPHQGQAGSKALSSCVDPSGSKLDRLPTNVQPTVIRQWLKSSSFSASDYSKFDHWAKCDAADKSKTCFIDFPQPREYNTDLAAAPPKLSGSSVDGLILGPIGGGIVGGVLLFLAVWYKCSKSLSMRATKNIFNTNIDGPVRFFRRFIIISGVFFGIVAIAALGLGVFLYTTVGEFLKVALLFAFLLALDLLIMAFVGTTAAYFRAMAMLFINSFGLLIAFAVMCFATYLVDYIGANIVTPPCTTTGDEVGLADACTETQTEDVALCGFKNAGCELREVWKSAVSDFPDKVCAFQDELECSGYLVACDKNPSSDFCPKGCDPTDPEERTSRYGDACKIKLQNDIADNCKNTLFPLMIALTICMAGALINNFILAILLKMQRSRQRDAQVDQLRCFTQSQIGKNKDGMVGAGSKSKAVRLLRCLSQEQRQKIAKRFKDADKDGNGTLDRKELSLFLKAVLSSDLTKAELDEAFDLADRNKDGTVDLSEFIDLFDPGSSKKGGEMTKPTKSSPTPAAVAAENTGNTSPRAGGSYSAMKSEEPAASGSAVKSPQPRARPAPGGRGAPRRPASSSKTGAV